MGVSSGDGVQARTLFEASGKPEIAIETPTYYLGFKSSQPTRHVVGKNFSLNIAKDQLRAAMRDRRERLSPVESRFCAERIAERLLKLPEIISVRSIALYSPIRGEVSTEPAYSQLRRGVEAIYFPRVPDSGTGPIEFVRINDWQQLIRGYAGILEPPPSFPAAPIDEIGAMVIPGLAFDIHGQRLGWGKGFYDRVLKKYSGIRVGLGYDFQLLDQIPSGVHDEPMAFVITEKRVVSTGGIG